MKEINNIVVPIDFSEESLRGIEAAASFGMKFESKIHFVHFTTPELVETNLHPKDAVLGNENTHHHKRLEQEAIAAEEKLKELMQDMIPSKFQGRSHAVPGTFETVLEDLEKEVPVDLIVSGSSGSRNLIEFFTGSKTEGLIRENEIPVISIPDDEEIRLKNILIATDLSGHVPKKIFAVCRFFQQLGAQLHFVNVITTELIQKEEVIKKIEALAKSQDIDDYDVHVLTCKTETEGILKISDKIDADLVLLKTYEKSRFWTFVKGSLAEQMTRSSEVPVMIENISKTRW